MADADEVEGLHEDMTRDESGAADQRGAPAEQLKKEAHRWSSEQAAQAFWAATGPISVTLDEFSIVRKILDTAIQTLGEGISGALDKPTELVER